MSVSHSVFCVGWTHSVELQVVLSAAASATQNRVKNAHGGPKRRLREAPTAVGGHVGGIASELRKHPKHGSWVNPRVKVLVLVNP